MRSGKGTLLLHNSHALKTNALIFALLCMTEKTRAYLYLHICVFVWGFTAILGKLISLQALPLVWWRVLLCCVVLWWFIPKAQRVAVSRKQRWQLVGIGCIVGAHWLGFYGAIKYANASVAVVSMATTSFFTALLEPLILKKPFQWFELLLGLFILPGIVLLVGGLSWEYERGLWIGIVGAVLAACFSVLNKKMVDTHRPPPLMMSFFELGGALLFTSAVLPFVLQHQPDLAIWPQPNDWLWLCILAIVCTLLPYYLTLQAIRHLSIFTTNLTINLEPVYGVILAGLIFKEHLTLGWQFYGGMLIILVAVFIHPLWRTWYARR